MYGKSSYLSLNFAVNLKLLEKKKKKYNDASSGANGAPFNGADDEMFIRNRQKILKKFLLL